MDILQVSVIGAANPTTEQRKFAYDLGLAIGHKRWTLITGGMGGVMEAAAQGVVEAGGDAVGILPTYEKGSGNRYNSITIPTGMRHARNVIVVGSGDVVIAVGGSYGTLSEIAIALKLGKPVAVFDSFSDIEGVYRVSTMNEVIEFVISNKPKAN